MKWNELWGGVVRKCAAYPGEWLLLLISLAIALQLTFIYYPGILNADAYERWNLVMPVLQRVTATHVTLMPCLWMALIYSITHSYAAFTLFQSTLLFFTSFLLVKRLGGFNSYWMVCPIILLTLFPPAQSYSAAHLAGVGTVIGINLFLLLSLREKEEKTVSRRTFVLLSIAYFVIFTVIFGFEQSALSMIPVVVFVIIKTAKDTKTRLVRFACLVLALLLVAAMPYMAVLCRHVERRDITGVALAWEIETMLDKLKKREYAHYLDYAAWSSVGDKTVVDYTLQSPWERMMSKWRLSYAELRKPETAARVRKSFLELIRKEPAFFIKNRVSLYSKLLGISQPLPVIDLEPNKGGYANLYGCRFTFMRRQQFAVIGSFLKKYDVLRMPYQVLVAGFLFLVIGLLNAKGGLQPMGMLYAFALFYYAGYFVIIPFIEFRYFFPSLYLITMLFVTVLTQTLQLIVERVVPEYLR